MCVCVCVDFTTFQRRDFIAKLCLDRRIDQSAGLQAAPRSVCPQWRRHLMMAYRSAAPIDGHASAIIVIFSALMNW